MYSRNILNQIPSGIGTLNLGGLNSTKENNVLGQYQIL